MRPRTYPYVQEKQTGLLCGPRPNLPMPPVGTKAGANWPAGAMCLLEKISHYAKRSNIMNSPLLVSYSIRDCLIYQQNYLDLCRINKDLTLGALLYGSNKICQEQRWSGIGQETLSSSILTFLSTRGEQLSTPFYSPTNLCLRLSTP